MTTPESGDGRPGRGGAVVGDEGDVVPWRVLLGETVERLERAGLDNARQEARWLVQRAGGFDGSEVVTGLDQPATVRGATHLHLMVERRERGEPLQYVLGRWAFRELELFVDERVLIPRPETEVLVGFALDEIRRLGSRVAVDLGTGSGAIALALAVEQPELEVWATDASRDALAVARANLAGLGRRARLVRLVEGDWFSALPDELAGRVGVVVANPPYVAEHEVPDLPSEVRDWEPRRALVSGPTGLEDIERILAEAPRWLARPGSILIEMAPHQTRAARQLALAGGFATATVWPDQAGRDRVLVARI